MRKLSFFITKNPADTPGFFHYRKQMIVILMAKIIMTIPALKKFFLDDSVLFPSATVMIQVMATMDIYPMIMPTMIPNLMWEKLDIIIAIPVTFPINIDDTFMLLVFELSLLDHLTLIMVNAIPMMAMLLIIIVPWVSVFVVSEIIIPGLLSPLAMFFV